MEALTYHEDTEYKFTKKGYNSIVESCGSDDIHKGFILILDVASRIIQYRILKNQCVKDMETIKAIPKSGRKHIYIETGGHYLFLAQISPCLLENVPTEIEKQVILLQQQVEEYRKECADLREVISSFREFSKDFETLVKKD